MAEHNSPCIPLARQEERLASISPTLVRIEAMLKTALEEGADREARLQVLERECANCERKKAAFTKAMWGFLFALLLTMITGFGGLLWKLAPIISFGR